MRTRRRAESFIPFQIIIRTFDKGRSPFERTMYGLLTLVCIVMLTAGIIRAFNGDIAIVEMIRLGVVWFFALLQLTLMVMYAVQCIRNGKKLYATNQLKAIGNYALGILCSLVAVALVAAFVYIIFFYR